MVRAEGKRADATAGPNALQTSRGARKPPAGLPGALALMLVLAGCSEKNAYVPPPPPKVTVSQPLQQPVTRYIELTGNSQAVNNVDLEARVQGYLETINYKDGALVTKGTLLFGIQRNTYEAQLLQAKASLTSAQAGQVNAQTEYTRQATLGKDQFASQARVDDAKTKLDQAIAAVENAKAQVDLATINLSYTEVTAPFDGIVSRHLADVGALVGQTGPTKLATIVQVNPIYVYFNISETIVLRIKEAMARIGRNPRDIKDIPVEVGLQTETGYPHKGLLDYVAPQIDPSTGTLEVRGILDNKDVALVPGLFVRVRVPVQHLDKGLFVDDTSVGTNQLGEYLLVVNKDNVVEQRQVKLGQLDGRYRVIESGITADDWVITNGMQRAVPGNKVDPDKKPMTTATASDKPATSQ
jgi:membrane fusion protein, multidrug efflux system